MISGSRLAGPIVALVLGALIGLGTVPARGQSSSEDFPIPDDDVSRISESGQFAGYAMACGLDWESYYLAVMRAERTKRWDQAQIALIGALFGFVPRRAADSIGDCAAGLRTRLKHEIPPPHECTRPVNPGMPHILAMGPDGG